MHPYIAEQLVRAHSADLSREADAARLAKRAKAPKHLAPAGRVRTAVGGGLVRIGLRLAGAPGAHATDW
jgi:hypothetical protein